MSLMSLEGKVKPGYSRCILINDSNNLAIVVQPRVAPQATKLDPQVLASVHVGQILLEKDAQYNLKQGNGILVLKFTAINSSLGGLIAFGGTYQCVTGGTHGGENPPSS